MQDEQLERDAQPLRGKVAGGIVAGGDASQQSHQHSEFTRQDVGDYTALGVDEDGVETETLAAHLPPSAVERGEPAVIEEQARDHVEPFITGGASNPGEARKTLSV